MSFRFLPLSLAVAGLFPALLYAEDVSQQVEAAKELKTINVKSHRNRTSPTVERKNREAINREMIRDTRDLVRYSADVGVAENGRRMKGFAMRGVEDNRVGISIDGVALPDSEENSLYARYGNFNNSRLSIDPELVRGIDISKGSDSFDSGSGALGGNVNYRTLDANDILLPERTFGGMVKSGYATKNREWVNTVGLGFMNDQFDGVLLYSHRHGHEMKNNVGDVTPVASSRYDTPAEVERMTQIGSARIHSDPSDDKSHSYLAKFGWQITPEHRLGFGINGQKNSKYTYEHSYAISKYGSEFREADDVQKRLNANLHYEYRPERVLALLRADLDYQKTENGAINYKGNYKRAGSSYLDPYTYDKDYTANIDNRNALTKFGRLSLQADGQTFQALGMAHNLSFKAFVSQRAFEIVNDDRTYNRDGILSGQPRIYTIQVPTKTRHYGFSLSDNFVINDTFSGRLGVRYDHTKISPQNFKDGVPCTSACATVGIPDAATFKSWTGTLGLNAKLNSTWRTGYNMSTGYRVPTSSEMYFTYNNPYGKWMPNPNLKPERSINHTLFLSAKNDKGTLDLNLYHTRYRNFLFEKESVFNEPRGICQDRPSWCKPIGWLEPTWPTPYQQMVNADKARVSGVEFSGSLNLGKGFKALGTLGYSKGTIETNGHKIGMMSIQPLKLVLGLDYEAPSEKWGVYTRLTHMGAKKAKDAQVIEQESRCVAYDSGDCAKEEFYDNVRDFRWLNKRAWVFDVFGFYRPTKNLTLRAGVYNVFNTRYHTWDTLRGINRNSTINSLPSREKDAALAQQGLNRYYAPPRNYAVSLEWKF